MAVDQLVPVGQPWSLRPPAPLGRGVVIDLGGAIPAGWAHAPRVRIGVDQVADPAPVLSILRGVAADGVGPVIEIAKPARVVLSRFHAPDQPGRVHPWEVSIGPPCGLEALWNAIWSNALDLRPDQFGWWALERALQLGARLPSDAEIAGHEPLGDVCTPTGRWCWLDGGVPRLIIVEGAHVLPAVSLEHGSLEPPRHVQSPAVLSTTQRAAVQERSGAVRVIAPAGSGKTRVLTERARHLIDVWRLPPSAITLLAFNRRARNELVDRTRDLPGLQIRTLNSIALAIVNGTEPFAERDDQRRTIAEPRARAIMASVLGSHPVSGSDGASSARGGCDGDLVGVYLEALVRIRLRLRPPSEVAEQFSERAPDMTRIWTRYLAALQRDGLVDFDGQIHLALEILLNDPVARRRAQRSCRMLLVDEFQDLNPAHMLLIQLLAAPGGAIYGVGDDDQTIYGYAGAQPDWLIDFTEQVPMAASHRLDVNHRCPPAVVRAATALLGHNHRRVPKRIEAAPRSAGSVDRPIAMGSADLSDQPELQIISSPDPLGDTVTAVVGAIEQATAMSSIAVLARVNALLVPVHIALARRSIPVNAAGSAEFIQHRLVRVVWAWWRLSAARPGTRVDADDLRTIIDHAVGTRLDPSSTATGPRPAGRIPADLTVRDLEALCRRSAISDRASLQQVSSVLGVCRRAARSNRSSSEWLETLCQQTGLGRMQAAHTTAGDGVLEHDHLTALRQLARLAPSFGQFGPLLSQIGQLSVGIDGVMLSTIHRVKGLEWPFVVVHQADAARFPHRLADDIEEERRILHVGLTRAAGRCVVVTGSDPSPFITEIGIC